MSRMKREDVLAAIRELAAKLKRNPTRQEMWKLKGITRARFEHHFGGFRFALQEAGLEPTGSGHPLTAERLLLDWARVVRKMGKLPSLSLYRQHGNYNVFALAKKFGSAAEVPRYFIRLVREKKIVAKWKDVLALIAKKNGGGAPANLKLDPAKHREDRPVYGRPLFCPGAAHEPVNELGVIYLFGFLARQLGFMVLRLQPGFPDCEAMREVGPGHWQRVRIEFEFASRNFKLHGHHKGDCDMIVCWIHDWPDCPKELEVLELKKAVVG